MEKKTSPIFIVKIILDVIMVVFLVLMYKKTAISMSFHEIGGLVIFGLFIIHNILNIRWIGSATAKLFKKGTGAKLRISWIVNLLLFLCMAGIILTGLSMSRTLPFRISLFSGASRWHYFMAALSIILMGVHLGLHWPLIKGLASKLTFLPAKIARAIGMVALVAALLAGCYFLITGSFMRWICSPFNSFSFRVEENAEFNKRLENFDGKDFDFNSGEFSMEDLPDVSNINPENMPNSENFDPSNMPNGGHLSSPPDGTQLPEGFSADNKPSKGDGANFPGGKMGFGEAGTNQGSVISNIFKVILTYGTEIVVFAFITVMLSKLKKKSDDDEEDDDDDSDNEDESNLDEDSEEGKDED